VNIVIQSLSNNYTSLLCLSASNTVTELSQTAVRRELFRWTFWFFCCLLLESLCGLMILFFQFIFISFFLIFLLWTVTLSVFLLVYLSVSLFPSSFSSGSPLFYLLCAFVIHFAFSTRDLTSHPITTLVGSRLWKITVVIGWLTERCSEWDITLKVKVVNLQKCADRRRLWDWRRNWHSHEILIRLFPDHMKMAYAINFAKFWTTVCTPRASGMP